jgi:hypothetical protein
MPLEITLVNEHEQVIDQVRSGDPVTGTTCGV